MAKNLLIVESPAKAKTITKYLGEDFVVASSYGHICDLPKNNNAIDIQNKFKATYIVSPEKEKVVAELKKLKKSVSEVYLATDEDREGEAISWHLCNVLGLDEKTAKRVTYTEITESAIKKAIQNPRTIDMDLVNAQQARRVLDRIVGFEVSPILWRKVKPSLSAGRVQSVAVRIIVDREREIQKFSSKGFYRLAAFFKAKDIEGKNVLIKADAPNDYDQKDQAKSIVESFIGAKFKIGDIAKKPGKRSPSAPFTTSSLQQEASKKLYFPVAKTMRVAQKLYEEGHITYMRTDSVSLSETALNDSKKAIESMYGPKYHKKRTYTSKIANAQEAHEAIRPTNMSSAYIKSESDEMRLYELIWKRTIASQMSDAEIENTIVTINNDKNEIPLIAKQEVIVFDGFLKAYVIEKEEDDDEETSEVLLPPMNIGDMLGLNNLTATERFTKNPPRYNEASLVKKLEELGIGRPSTYAPTISTIQTRDYVQRDTREGKEVSYQVFELADEKVTEHKKKMIVGAEKNKLFPTDIGMLVTDFLTQYFTSIVDYKFTAKIEEEFDKISHGKVEWTKVLSDFYAPFHQTVDETIENAERISGERILGNHPTTGDVILVRMGRFGPMAQIGVTSEENPNFKPQYAKLRKGQNIETISLEEALDLFKMPRTIGEFEGKPIKVNIGRFGPYIQLGTDFISIPKEDDPFTIEFERAIEVIIAKRQADADRIIKSFDENGMQVLNGRWGPFIKHDGENYKIPKTIEAKELSFAECMELVEKQSASAKPKRTFGGKKTAKFTKKK